MGDESLEHNSNPGLTMAMDPKQIAQQFVAHYYNLFDSDRTQLAPLYNEASTMQFEASAAGGDELKGQANIMGKLTNLTFTSVKHDLPTARLDVQTTKCGTGIIAVVTGALQADGGNPMNFAETFILHQAPGGASWYIHNQVFRLCNI